MHIYNKWGVIGGGLWASHEPKRCRMFRNTCQSRFTRLLIFSLIFIFLLMGALGSPIALHHTLQSSLIIYILVNGGALSSPIALHHTLQSSLFSLHHKLQSSLFSILASWKLKQYDDSYLVVQHI